jgi:hypothetical protein
MNLEVAQTFVEMNSRPITEANRSSRCIDGRYIETENCPLASKPGGDAGDLLAAFAALNILQIAVDPQIVLNAVLETVGGAANFQFHTDDHAGGVNGPAGLGCGHLKQAQNDPVSYGVTQHQVDFIFQSLPKLIEQGAHQEILHGEHQEQAVLVTNSQTHGVVPQVTLGQRVISAFVYQQSLHAEHLDKLAKVMQTTLAANGVTVEEPQLRQALDQALGKQISETLKRLAKGLPVYTVLIDSEGEVSVAS